MKMREARDKEQMMKIMCLQSRKNAAALGKSAFQTLKIQKYYVFEKKKALIVKRPFPFSGAIFCQKKRPFRV